MQTKETRAALHITQRLQGLGLWNIYFIAKFALAATGFITLNLVANVLLVLFLSLKMSSRLMQSVQAILGVLLAAALLYAESWLPPVSSIVMNAQNIAGFSWNYIAELALDFVNWEMLAWFAVIVLGYAIVSHYVRLSTITLTYLAYLSVSPLWQQAPAVTQTPFATEVAHSAQAPEVAPAATAVAAALPATSETLAKWYNAFLAYEKDRKAPLPAGLNAKDTPFDIVIMNVCSLATSDLAAAGLAEHPVISRFNVHFDRFNTATSYSGPATLRLLTGACGQVSHDALYDGRRPECEIMNRLEQLGFAQHMYLDHAGDYDQYLKTMREKAGLTAPLDSTARYPVRYVGFDDEPISDTLAVLRDWQKNIVKAKESRTVTFMNFIALHDGNRLPRQAESLAFKPRAKRFLDDLNRFFNELERTKRPVMFIVVPEHGAAVEGDRVQAARLRDIPSMRITEVPVWVKFFGLKLPEVPVHVTDNTSYLALTSLIGKVLEMNFYGQKSGSVALEELVKGLPQTNPVSENAQSIVLTYKDRDYIRKGDEWVVYPK